MADHTLLPERIFGLSVVDGRRTVRPGTVVRFRFRARNVSEIATPPARLTFALPPGWSALDPLAVDIPPVRAGGEHEVWLAAKPDIADDATSVSRVQAALHVDDVVLGSNVVTVRVIGSARFNAPASSVRVESAHGETLRVAVEVVNEGDAAAHAVRVVVPPPPGFIADPDATVGTHPELKPGESFGFAFEMRPVAPTTANVAIDDAYVTFAGGRSALITGSSCQLAPDLPPPAIEARRTANRLDVAVRVHNDGWIPAHDVRCVLELPNGWRILRGTLLADGAPAVLRRDPGTENGVTITLPFVPARGSVDVTVVASAARGAEGAIVVRLGDRSAELPIPRPVVRALHIDGRPESAFAEPGSPVAIAIDVMNAGETVEVVTVRIDGEPCWTEELRPGASAAFVGRTTVPAALRDGNSFTTRLAAAGSDGETLATAAIDVRALDRPWIAVDEVAVDGAQARVIVRNVGATTARDIRLAGESDARIASLAPGESQSILVDAIAARHASVVGSDGAAVLVGWDVQAEAVTVAAALHAVQTVRAGQRLDVRLVCVAPDSVEALRVRPRSHTGAVYVAGSTTINGFAIVDGADGPPLLIGEGLALYDIPAGTQAEIGWSLLPRTPGELTLGVDVEANGIAVEVASLVVKVIDALPFGARPTALPFHIDAATVAEPSRPPAPPAAPPIAPPAAAVDPFAAGSMQAERRLIEYAARNRPAGAYGSTAPALRALLTIDEAGWGQIRRVLRGSRGPGIIGHFPAIAVAFPNGAGSSDDMVSGALTLAGDAVRNVYQKLFVKLRIPGYDVTPDDFEDATSRADLIGFIDAVIGAPADTYRTYPSGTLERALDVNALVAARARLDGTPIGDPAALAALTLILPVAATSEPAIALGSYVAAFAREVAERSTLAGDAFVASIVSQGSAELDSAREAVVLALDAEGEVAAR